MDSCSFTDNANSHTSKVEIHTRPKLCHFGRYVVIAKLICLKSFGVFIWENFHPGYRDLGNRVSPASHMITSINIQRKEWAGEISERRRSQPGRPGSYEEALTLASFCQLYFKMPTYHTFVSEKSKSIQKKIKGLRIIAWMELKLRDLTLFLIPMV